MHGAAVLLVLRELRIAKCVVDMIAERCAHDRIVV